MEGEGSEWKKNVDEAIAYCNTVKEKFRDEPAKYRTFLEIVHNVKTQGVDQKACIKEVEKLFNGDQDLIAGFDKFMPEGLEIGEGAGVVVE